jgi:DNA-binding response OmpR family regulator
MPRVLIIEDDPLIMEPMVRALKGAGFEVLQAMDGSQGLSKALELQPDIVVLDILLPEIDGWEVCKALRAKSTVPILMVTALNDEIDRVLGLELGADEYLAKPFSTRELLARIKALLRRVELDATQYSQMHTVQIKDVALNLQTRRATKNGSEMPLRYKEFELLSLLMTNAGEVVSRAEIFDKVWGTDWLGDMRTLDVHIRWLREKLEDDSSNPHYIQTVRSIGYRFMPD